MIHVSEMRDLSRARLRDARVLFRGKRYDAARYICGYAIEIALKARICRTLRWKGFPSSNKEFAYYLSFRTHVLEHLLHLSGQEDRITTRYKPEWSLLSSWNPEIRYLPIGTGDRNDVREMINAAHVLVRVLL